MITLKTAIKSTLIIDKDDFNNTNLIGVFKEKGLMLDTISDEHDYIEKLEKNQYDCVMIDGELPNNQTNKIIDEIKGNYPWILVVIFLKSADYTKIIKFVRLGADDFLVKPFTWDDLENLLRHYYY